MKNPRYVVAFVLVASTLLPRAVRPQSVEQGIQLFDAKKYVEAREVLLLHGQGDASAAFYLGRIEMENGDGAQAVEWFERAVTKNPKSAVYHDWLGRAYATQAQKVSLFKGPFLARKAKDALETAVALDPDNLDVRDDLVRYYAGAPGFVGGNKEKAGEMVLEIKKRNAYRGSLAAANLCVVAKDVVCAERELTGMVTSYPDSPVVYASLASLYANQNQFDKAFVVLDKRLRAKPNEPTALYQVGRTASLSGQNLDRGEKALKTYLANPAPERGPTPAHVHYRLGTIYEKKGDKDLAREEYRAALQLNPKQLEAQTALAGLK
jgi:tetratricopeptide (TPR) repeat protein